ncbi:Crp/Fnr family transcriptional regulator [Vannielia litorea]|uniref:cAMP-binding domain of CRP or a regulatory subunit of cAMP-dependent protein kinases n=1 Tax=Vannielia litorea TaxID=1217970 RepID=A0A1N6FYZ8_9RHOB|nr:Crp/Fnr family transcriptional regulator [Vannielia litorea]SIO00447.1 cAMP-binding domain of CRP or a regulatory subunit of cAMP-dependent protein kinases [Vannielia litorea]
MTSEEQLPVDHLEMADGADISEDVPTPVALDARYRCGMSRHISPALWERLDRACTEIRTLEPRTTFSRAGERLRHSALLLEGLMVRYVVSNRGPQPNRQMVSIQVPGDFVDLHALPLKHLDHDVATLTQARIALFPHDALEEIIAADPEHARTLWKLTMIDASIHRHWIYRGGTLRAMAAMADFLCEMETRLSACGLVDQGNVPLPLLHSDLSEICGISNVHVSRVARDLRDAGLSTVRDGVAQIHDRPALQKLANFDPGYLYLPPDGGAPH